MKYKVIFDSNSPAWERSRELNLMFMKQQTLYWTTMLQKRGYVYLNQLYESIGVEWSPENENTCFKIGEYSSVTFSIRRLHDETYGVSINIQ